MSNGKPPQTDTREAMILKYYPVLRTIARTVFRQMPNAELDDLIGDGCVGLIRAVDTFDPSRGMSFERYVRRLMFYSMVDGVRRVDRVSPLARSVLRRAESDRYTLAVSRGEMPSRLEMETRHPKLRSAQWAVYRRPLSTCDVASEQISAGSWELDPACCYDVSETHRSVRKALERLPARHRRVLTLYYSRGFPFTAVGRELSLTKQRIAQLHRDALTSVREGVLAS